MSNHAKVAYDTGSTAFKIFRFEHTFPNVWPPLLKHIAQFIAYLSLKLFSSQFVKCQKIYLP